jgi:hypothetical protein
MQKTSFGSIYSGSVWDRLTSYFLPPSDACNPSDASLYAQRLWSPSEDKTSALRLLVIYCYAAWAPIAHLDMRVSESFVLTAKVDNLRWGAKVDNLHKHGGFQAWMSQ